jgi:hypothetical protein
LNENIIPQVDKLKQLSLELIKISGYKNIKVDDLKF